MALFDDSHRLIRMPEVLHLTGLSKSTVYRKMDLGDFPMKVKPSEGSSAWWRDEVLAWMESRPRGSTQG